MNDRALKLLEQYELEVIGTRRGRGAWLLETSEGLRILSDYYGSENRALFQNKVMKKIRDGGYANVDVILPNKEGILVSKDWEENRYVVKEWYAGRECDPSSESEVLNAVQNLARLHRLMRLEEDAELHNAPESGDSVANLSGENPQASVSAPLRSALNGHPLDVQSPSDRLYYEKKTASHNAPESDDSVANLSGENPQARFPSDRLYCARSPFDELRSWNTQLRKIRSFIRSRGHRSAFEQLFLNCFETYYGQAQAAVEQLGDIHDRLEALREDQSGLVCHGDYSHHHVLMCGYQISTTNFDNCRRDFQVNDLYRFMRKILEKHDWNVRLGMRMLETYGRIRPISGIERRLIYVRMLYPEKFRKLAGSYYGGSKAWISRQYLDKLEKMNRQEAARTEFVKILAK
ncbi:MAG: hypothetical protein LUI07_09465 [Lachnospiraceae bacterium]|nr:hypothetical protein [Lachnospiraceae bacterium]